MQMFSIGEIARKAGVATSTIRYYERIGLLPPSTRVSGKRQYDTTILQKLRLIRMSQQAGFTIAEIQMLLHGFPADTPPALRWQTLAQHKRAEVEALIKRTERMKHLLDNSLQCTCLRIEDCQLLDDDGDCQTA